MPTAACHSMLWRPRVVVTPGSGASTPGYAGWQIGIISVAGSGFGAMQCMWEWAAGYVSKTDWPTSRKDT